MKRDTKPKARPPARAAEADARRLVHDLEVQRIELEMQNEELKTARVDMEIALERYTQLFDFAPIGYARLAPSGVILELNHAGALLLGKERGRLIQRQFGPFLTDGHRQIFRELLRDVAESQQKRGGETQLQVHGATRQLRFWAASLGRGEPMVMVAFEDITEHKAREEALARSEAALRDADRRKDEFIAMLSHELRNPLAGIRGGLTVFTRTEPGSERARRTRAILERQVQHLARLVDDLLDVTRIARGKIQLKLEPCDLRELVRSTVEEYRASFQSQELSLDLRTEPEPVWVNADPARIVQVLNNLLGNAQKFTGRGGQVTVSLTSQGEKAVFRIRDNGVGIAPELLGHLFEPFSQAPQSIDRSQGGLGLGLAMVKGLVELHGGAVVVASEGLDRGTEFAVTLALGAPPAEAPEPAPAATPVSGRRVLVIEDNADYAQILKDTLTLSGHDVQVADDGLSGLERAREFHPEIVVCDLGLPGMSGYSVAQAFRADETLRSTYLVALSGYAQPDAVDRATHAGFDEHVAKPPSPDRLNRLLAEAPNTNQKKPSTFLH